jgi:hypothetical protein
MSNPSNPSPYDLSAIPYFRKGYTRTRRCNFKPKNCCLNTNGTPPNRDATETKENKMNECVSQSGSHCFEPRYDETIDSGIVAKIKDYVAVSELYVGPDQMAIMIKAATSRKYVYDVCTYCGKTVQKTPPDNG